MTEKSFVQDFTSSVTAQIIDTNKHEERIAALEKQVCILANILKYHDIQWVSCEECFNYRASTTSIMNVKQKMFVNICDNLECAMFICNNCKSSHNCK